jgi:hypothetical protein
MQKNKMGVREGDDVEAENIQLSQNEYGHLNAHQQFAQENLKSRYLTKEETWTSRNSCMG